MKRAFSILLAIIVGVNAYYTYRAYRFAKASEHYFQYLNSGMHCLIQKDGFHDTDSEILYKGYRSRKAYDDAVFKKTGYHILAEEFLAIKKSYDGQIPQCKEFYSQFLCWELDPHDIKSLEGCGAHFGFTTQDIEKIRKDPSKADQVSDEVWNRRKEEAKK